MYIYFTGAVLQVAEEKHGLAEIHIVAGHAFLPLQFKEVSIPEASLYFLAIFWGQVVALSRSHVNGSIPFERTIKQTAETIPVALKR